MGHSISETLKYRKYCVAIDEFIEGALEVTYCFYKCYIPQLVEQDVIDISMLPESGSRILTGEPSYPMPPPLNA